MAASKNWLEIVESPFAWEREALEFVRSQFPTHDPYRAWTNFEFIADDGSVNEIDLLAFTPQGFFLVEIKSRPGKLRGDSRTWVWETDQQIRTIDNPYYLANLKAKKLRSLLNRQKAFRGKGEAPRIDALVFCSAPDLACELQGLDRAHICLRDRPATPDKPARPGILAALKRREYEGVIPISSSTLYNTPTMKLVAQALDQAGIRPSNRSRKVSDYLLEQLINEGPGYQDWRAAHTRLSSAHRRVRIYNVRAGATIDERLTIERAARREAELLESLQHPGVLRREGFTEHELGPALIFEHHSHALRLDHFLTQQHDKLSIAQRLDLVRQIAEVIKFAHEKRIVHRALCPQSVLVLPGEQGRWQVKVFNWQVGYRDSASGSSNASRTISATRHVERLVEDINTAYMAPEVITDDDHLGEHLDIFSLGAIAYHIISGVPPAADGIELGQKLRETGGLQLSAVVNGASGTLQELIEWSTQPNVASRSGVVTTVVDFLDMLGKVEEEEAAADKEPLVEDPDLARNGDLLPGGYRVVKRIGKGAVSIALWVERNGTPLIMKVASSPEFNQQLLDEADVLQKLRHVNLVHFVESTRIGDREAFLMRPVLVTVNDQPEIETLGRRLRDDGQLSVDMLQQFGDDLLEAVKHLEDQGINHRDIKPDNIAVGHVGAGKKLHLVLFDFSLSRTPPENIRAGTTRYLDPFLPLREHKRWDLHAERYAAAVTLFELAAGPNNFPVWGDGVSNPAQLNCEATIDAELFDAAVREPLTQFFQKAFRRDPRQRFDNASVMQNAWRACFQELNEPSSDTDPVDQLRLEQRLANATFDTQIPELGLGTRAANALDRANILTVEDLLTASLRRLSRLRGVGNKTRREIIAAVHLLRQRLGAPARPSNDGTPPPPTTPSPTTTDLPENPSIDQLLAHLLHPSANDGDTARATLLALLGLDARLAPAPAADNTRPPDRWPGQVDVAAVVNVTRARVGQLVAKFQNRWSQDPAITRLRRDIANLLNNAGGVMTVGELAEALLIARGSIEDEPRRSAAAIAVARAACEAERLESSPDAQEPRFQVRRHRGRVLIATSVEWSGYAGELGEWADRLAQEDPLAAPARVLQRLREVPTPEGATPLTDARLVRLAAAASQQAALSSRQELYPRGLDAARALKLSGGALYGVSYLTVQDVRDRVRSRYPEAAELPDHPALLDLLRNAGFDLVWDDQGRGGGGYLSRLSDAAPLTSTSESLGPLANRANSSDDLEGTPEFASIRQFEERLSRGLQEGSFLALVVNPKNYQRAIDGLCRKFGVESIDVEGLFIDSLREVCQKANAKWEAVVNADASRKSNAWHKFMTLVERAMPLVKQRLNQSTRPTLLTYPGLLARYDQLPLLEHLRDNVGRRAGIPSVWLLVPGDHQPTLEGKVVPILGPGQRATIPDDWLKTL
jgi:serine/threonine protein kinase